MKKPPIYDRIVAGLEERRSSGLFRFAVPFESDSIIDMSTNSYLWLHENVTVRREALRLSDEELAGNCASRLISTRSPLYQELESEIAAWKNCESALVFNSGYAANIGILQALASRGTEIFSDRLNHASIIDGIRLSGARMTRYRHCDMNDLEKRLAASGSKEKIIVTDSVFSMDGDRAPLADISGLASKHGCIVMVDEAHAAGLFGRGLSGLVEETHLEDRVDIRMGTLSKAAAGLGGFFAGSEIMRDHLVNNARSLIYSTALPHSVIAWDLAAVRHIRSHTYEGREVLDKADRFRQRLNRLGIDTLGSSTQIVPCVVKDENRAVALSRALMEKGIKAPAIRPPSVPKGTSRIRFSIHLGIDEEEMEKTAGWLEKLMG